MFRRIQEADADKSGSISVSELYLVIKGAAESDKQKRLFARLLGGAVVIIFLLIGAMLGMGIVAGEAVKESHVTGGHASLPEATPPAVMTSTDGRTVVQTDTVETGVSIFDVPLVLLDHGVDAMSKIKRLSFYIDQSADPTPSWKLVAFTVTGFEVDIDNAGVCNLFTASGAVMNLNSMNQNGASAPPLRDQRGCPRPAPPCPRLLTLQGRACCHPGPLGPRRRRLDHGARQYVPHLRGLPEDIERRRLSAAKKTSVPRSSVVMWPVAAEIIEAEPIVADAVPSEFPQRRALRRAGSVSIRRMTNNRMRSGAVGGFALRAGFQGNH